MARRRSAQSRNRPLAPPPPRPHPPIPPRPYPPAPTPPIRAITLFPTPLSLTRRVADRPLIAGEDRRRWHPDAPFQPAPVLNVNHRRLTVPALNPARIAFSAPEQVITCIRRRRRKQVLHALRVAGQRGSKRPARRTPFSSISC